MEGLADPDGEDQQPWFDTLVLLGFATPAILTDTAIAERSAEVVGAYYDSEDETISVVTRDDTAVEYESATLVHEYVHALQDAADDLMALQQARPATIDASWALGSLVEGEADFHTTRAMAAMFGLHLDQLDLEQAFRNLRRRAEADLLAEPHPFFSSSTVIHYAYGPEYVNQVWVSGGRVGVRGLFDAPPATFYETFARVHGVDPEFFQPTEFGEPVIPDDNGATVWSTTSLGVWGVYLLLGGDSESALAWRGDRLVTFELESGGTALRWELEFADADVAALLVPSFPNAVQSRIYQTRLVVGAATDGPLDWLVTSSD
jgi:hypothetical protein